MTEQTQKTIEHYLLASFLSLAQIAERTGVTVAEVDEVMMRMYIPSEWNQE